MPKNIGKTDRIIRIVTGILVIVAGVVAHSWWGAAGIIPLLTSTLGFCPLYTLFGISSCGRCAIEEKPGKSSSRLS
ncbi:MAG: DUF2892 domain-containing protein [Chlorobium sp.]